MNADIPSIDWFKEMQKQSEYRQREEWFNHRAVPDTMLTAAQIQQMAVGREQHEKLRQLEVVKEFRKAYIKVRTDNIVLDHQTAIALVKMIREEADLLTFEDTQ